MTAAEPGAGHCLGVCRGGTTKNRPTEGEIGGEIGAFLRDVARRACARHGRSEGRGGAFLALAERAVTPAGRQPYNREDYPPRIPGPVLPISRVPRLSFRCWPGALVAISALCLAAWGLPPAPIPAPADPSPTARFQHAEAAFFHDSAAPARLVALYRLGEAAPQMPRQSRVLPALEKMAAAPGLPALLQGEVEAQIAAQQLRQGQAAAAASTWLALGELEHWRAVGPFDNSDGAFARAEGPETGIDLKADYSGKQGPVHWRVMPFPASQGVYDLDQLFTPSHGASAYFVTWVRSRRRQPVALRLVDSGYTRVWVNGALRFSEQASHPRSGFDMHAVGATLGAGWNEILVKTGSSEDHPWRFALRVTTPAGAPLQLASSEQPHRRAAAISGPVAVQELTVQAKAEAKTPQGAWDYAWILAKKGNYAAGQRVLATAFEAAEALNPQSARLLLDFAEHDSDGSRRYRTLQKALRLAPGDPRALADRGFVDLKRREYWPAREDFRAALAHVARPSDLPQAWVGLFATYAGFGIHPVAFHYLDLLERAGYQHAPGIAGLVAPTLERMDAFHRALPWAQGYAHADQSDLAAVFALANVQRQRGDFAAAVDTVEAAARAMPEAPILQRVLAQALAGQGQRAEALAASRRAVALNPENPSLRVDAGSVAAEFGGEGAALKDWRVALALNPQDANLRDRLRLAKGGATVEASFEQPYHVTLAAAIAADKRHPAAGAGPVTVLVDSTVVRIFPSGNVGRYVEQIFRVNNRAGAAQLNQYAVTYDPDKQEVRFIEARVRHPDGSISQAPQANDTPVNQSVGYETFYDVRDKWVQMPQIRPGDYVQVAYRILPITLESLYGQYYGDLVPFQTSAPERFQQLVVIAPRSVPLYWHAVRFRGRHDITQRGGQTVYRWTLRDEPAFTSEPNAPPDIEQEPYVEVSAFRTWNQFADWYRNLIRDVFVPDQALRRTTAGLIRGKASLRAKVQAIYNYVIRNTHYVALEFGIHGYRPYPVTEVFNRRFGDCKDKASLLVEMLALAKVPADIVLVRTRDLGLVSPAVPAVGDFDHAIVYVPALHLYLDGTAEYNGADELPSGDQRAFVFRIPVLLADPPRAHFHMAPAVTPELPASANLRDSEVSGSVDSQGDLHFTAHWTVRGEQAPELRAAMQMPPRQAGALQMMLRDPLPGISIDDVAVRGAHHWNRPIQITFQGEVPGFATPDAGGGARRLLIPRQMISHSWLPRLAPLARRRYPVLLGPPRTRTTVLKLRLPAGFQARLPGPFQASAPFAQVRATARVQDGVLRIATHVKILQSLIPVAEYAAFRAFWANVDAHLGQPVSAVAGGQS